MFPIIPYWLGVNFPETLRAFCLILSLCVEFGFAALTNSIKPVAQVLSHFPQLWLCVNMKSISGVSMLTQHLNVLGGVSGLMSNVVFFFYFGAQSYSVTSVIRPKTYATYLIYLNSCFQAISLYAVGLLYEGWPSLQLNARTFLTFGNSIIFFLPS
jgi:hypothetical protein